MTEQERGGYLVPADVVTELREWALRPMPYLVRWPHEAPRRVPLRVRFQLRWRGLRERIGFWVAGYQPEEEW